MARKFYIKSEKSFEFENNIIVEGDEFNHIANVLRYKIGDKITIIDGSGTDYECEIIEINKKNLLLKILSMKDCESETKSFVSVFQALVKGDKFELIIQKLTELGVKKLVPFSSEFCQVKPNTTRLDRLEKISIEALKQCGRAKQLEIDKVKSFKEMIEELSSYDKVVFAYENASENLSPKIFEDILKMKDKKVAIVVGSEGGFSKDEAKELENLKNIKTVSLGNRILRAETASITLTSIVMYLLGEMDKR
ncbi:MAG: 16S rRNA (uracil(1498)-N(3))-methyltransferase [Clostridiales bacterium]|nr:16S rRNA (uracil(1498)-N(3))-methyltransferase [Candidatus Apopatousia equi]